MTDSQLEVVDFDDFKGWYLKNLHKIGHATKYELKSIDTLYIPNPDILIFIEFKSGNVKKCDIRRKVSDSVAIYLDHRNERLSDFRRKSNFILVCSEDSREHLADMMDRKGSSHQNSYKSTYQDLKGFYFLQVKILSPKELEQELKTYTI